jgi:hypothetical protein
MPARAASLSRLAFASGWNWCAELDSNQHCAGFEAAASCQLGYQRVPAAGFEPALDRRLRPGLCQLGYAGEPPEQAGLPSAGVASGKKMLVRREGFEPTLSTF